MKVKCKPTWLVLGLIICLGIAFRTINYEKTFLFNHDQDLYSWIAKDILVNKHQRLVGQITSVDGVFIGSFYYYVAALAYRFGGMEPLSIYWPLTLIGIFNILSMYWVTKRHFGMKAGTIAGVIYAASWGVASYERWSVPTQPTLTWAIWFFEVTLEMLAGRWRWLPIYAFLVGFIWQVHIALLPLTPLPIMAYFLKGINLGEIQKKLRWILISIMIYGITSTPFWMFELKSNFSQIRGVLAATKIETGGPTGKRKFEKVVDASGREMQHRLFYGWEISNVSWYWIGLIIISGILAYTGGMNRKQLGLIWLWIGLVFGVQFMSKRIVSEYYFSNLIPMGMIMVAVWWSKINNNILVFGGLIGYIALNCWWISQKSDDDQSLFYKKQAVDYVIADAKSKGYPCLALNYIADLGVGVGFRYLFWQKGTILVKPSTMGVPIYNIPIPWQLSYRENPVHYGRYGVLLPNKSGTVTKAACEDKTNQLDPLLGYTD